MPQITVKAAINSIPTVTDFAVALLEEYQCDMRAQMQIDVAIDELFGNIAHYAYPQGTGEATVGVEFDADTRVVSVTFTDSGIPFDPLQKSDPNVALSAEEREVGGLGIFMVKKTMDQIRYRFENGRNILTICKKI